MPSSHLIFCRLPGARVRNPTHGKGHEEGGLTLCKGEIKPQGSPWRFSSIYPQNQSLPTLLHYAFTNSSDVNRGLSPNHLFLEKVNLELLDNKSPGHNTSVSIQKPLCTLTAAHVIVCGLPTMRGTGSLKHPRNVGASKESKSLK